jgi:hypothetical protein
MAWYRRWWVVGLGGLIVGLGIGGAASGGSTKTTTQTVADANARTVTQVRTITRPGRLRVKTVTAAAQAQAPAAAQTPAPPSNAAGGSGGGGPYHGDGQQQVGTINVAQDSTLHWACDGNCEIFGIANDPNDSNSISLTSSNGAHSGQTNISAGVYHKVQVITAGTWAFKITPG